jgi:hypothetical protein
MASRTFGYGGSHVRLLGKFVRHEESAPIGLEPPWYTLEYTFSVEAGEASLPTAPIRDKAKAIASLPQVLLAKARLPARGRDVVAAL